MGVYVRGVFVYGVFVLEPITSQNLKYIEVNMKKPISKPKTPKKHIRLKYRLKEKEEKNF